MNFAKHKAKLSSVRKQSHRSKMSAKTKGFIQKICYKKAASVDMTKRGFINDNKLYAVNLLLRPLRDKLEKIIGKNTEDRRGSLRKSSPMRKYKGFGTKVSKTQNLSENHNKIKNRKKPKQKCKSNK